MNSKFYTKAGFEPKYIWDWEITLRLYGIPGVKRPPQARLLPFSRLGNAWSGIELLIRFYLHKEYETSVLEGLIATAFDNEETFKKAQTMADKEEKSRFFFKKLPWLIWWWIIAKFWS